MVLSSLAEGIDVPDSMRILDTPLQSTKDHGLSVGLLVSKAIIKMHGSSLFIGDSDAGGCQSHPTLALERFITEHISIYAHWRIDRNLSCCESCICFCTSMRKPPPHASF